MVIGFFPTGSASLDFWNVNRIGKHKAIAFTYCSYSVTTVKQNSTS